MSESVVLCKDCRHGFRTVWDILFGSSSLKCRRAFRAEEVKIDPVHGAKRVKAHYEYCNIERSWGKDNCGKEGRNWEPRDPAKFFVYLKRI